MNLITSSRSSTDADVTLAVWQTTGAGIQLVVAGGTGSTHHLGCPSRIIVPGDITDGQCPCIENFLPTENGGAHIIARRRSRDASIVVEEVEDGRGRCPCDNSCGIGRPAIYTAGREINRGGTGCINLLSVEHPGLELDHLSDLGRCRRLSRLGMT